MTRSPSILIMLILRSPTRGMLVHNSLSFSQTQQIQKYTSLAVCFRRPPRLLIGLANSGPTSDAHHRFIPEECDWGFTRFIDLKKIYHPQDGHTRSLVEDDCTEITVFVRVLKDPTGVLWHNFVK